MGQFDAFEETYDFEWDVDGRVPFYVTLARETGGPVAEFACGAGRILLPIAREGMEVWGVEHSGPLAARFGRRLVDEGQAVRDLVHLVEAEPGQARLDKRFGLVMMAFGGLQLHVEDDESEAVLAVLAEHVAPAGLLALDLFRLGGTAREHPGLVRHVWTMERPKFRETVSRFQVLTRGRSSGRLELTIFLDTVDETGQISRRVVKQELRAFDPDTLGEALGRHGLSVEGVYGDAHRGAFDPDGECMFVVARKTG